MAGFDLTFSAPKSVSVAWALADPETRTLIYDAHQQALAHVIRYAEQHVFHSRSGRNGVVQEDIRGVVATAFDHWDSRTGDPQLHTHVVVMNRAQCVSDGVWRSLDSRGIFKAVVALSEMYNGVLSDYATQALGYGWEPLTRKHSEVAKWEIIGVPEKLQSEFSQRTAAIEDTKNQLVAGFVTAHGRSPSSREVLRLRQQATLMTRPDKHVYPLSDLVDGWRERATGIVPTDPEAWVATLAGRNDLPLLRCGDLSDGMLTDVGRVAVDTVAGRRATFTRSNVFAEVLRQLAGIRFATAGDRMDAAEHTTDLALAQALLISPPDLAHTPATFRREDGTSRFRAKGYETYTTAALLEAEARLVDAGRCLTGPRLTTRLVAEGDDSTTVRPGRRSSAEQASAVAQIVTSGRVVDVLVGPAGTGKSTTMGGLRTAWEHQYGAGSVIGLAPSATAAEVLAEQVGIPTENTVKWVTENTRNTQRLATINTLRADRSRMQPMNRTIALHRQHEQLCAEIRRWSLRAGQLVVVDEASLAGTFTLDALVTHARRTGAKVVLVGDWAQLSPVEAGGAFHLLVHDRDSVPELSDVHRFTHPWERTASVDLRAGVPDTIDTYQGHGRVAGGDRDTMLDQLYEAWRTDVVAGKRSLMIAGDNQTVTELNQRARADRVATGDVQPDGPQTSTGVVIGVGDLVITRQNNRRLAAGSGWVKNGDQWVVTATNTDGTMTVRRSARTQTTPGQIILPAEYVRDHVDLGYATTAHGAQGRTVDTAHAFVTVTTRREVLYVAATRGRDSNMLYVDICYDPDTETAHGPVSLQDAGDVLRQVLTAPGADVSATETIATEWAEQNSLTRLWADYQTLAATALHHRYDDLITTRSGLTVEQVDQVRRSPSYGTVVAALATAQAHGLDVNRALPQLVQARTLADADADDVAAVLHERVTHWACPTSLRRPVAPDRIVGLIPRVDATTDPDVQQALQERQALIERRARELSQDALHARQPWAVQLGNPPTDAVSREHWYRQLDTIATYRERWNITDRDPLGHEERHSIEQATQAQLAERALHTALRRHLQGARLVPRQNAVPEDQPGRMRPEL